MANCAFIDKRQVFLFWSGSRIMHVPAYLWDGDSICCSMCRDKYANDRYIGSIATYCYISVDVSIFSSSAISIYVTPQQLCLFSLTSAVRNIKPVVQAIHLGSWQR